MLQTLPSAVVSRARSIGNELHGVQGVGGSNPLAPINDLRALQKLSVSTFVSTFKK